MTSKPISIPPELAARCDGNDQAERLDKAFRAVLNTTHSAVKKDTAKRRRARARKIDEATENGRWRTGTCRHNFRSETIDIPHVSDPDAFAAFADGRGVFDVDPHGRKLDAFIAKHRLDAIVESDCLLPCANPQVTKRPVYFGRARWRKRSSFNPDQVA